MKISTLLIWCQVITGLGLCVRAQIPNCNFYDTVDLTNSQKFENGSYLYDGVLIPAELVAIYKYTEVDDVREEAPEHVRGCVCKVKQCVQFCCPLDKRKVTGENKCEAASEDQLEFEPYLNITDSKDVQHQLHIREDVVVQANLLCAEGFIWNRPEDVYNLYWNGVLVDEKSYSYTKNQYCISFGFGPDGAYGMMPMTCAPQQDSWNLISKCVMCVSIVCCLLTIFVNILVPELLKLLGKCLTSHLIALSVSFGFLVFNAFSGDFDDDTCIYIGIGTYFFIMASFFWLSVIGFDLYVTLRSTNFSHRYSQNRKFLFYSLYAWISALVLTVILTVLQYTMDGPLAPNLEYKCFVETDTWSAMIYLHAPLLIILGANTVFFTLTIYHIWQVQNGPNAVNAASAKREQADREVKQPMFGDSTKPQPSAREVQKRKQKEQFGLFLRMFLLMGIIWLVEVVSYMLPRDSTVKSILKYLDLLNCGKGILVFIIFICRKKVFVQVKNRILCKEIPAADLDSLYEFSLQDIGITTKQQNDDEN